MPFTPVEAAKLALIAMYAEDMRDAPPAGRLLPNPDARLAVDGWEIQAFIVAKDAILPKQAPLQLTAAKLYFGFVTKSTTIADTWLVAVRGTDGIVEWIIDARFFYAFGHPRGEGLEVEAGFWSIYESMELLRPDGSQLDSDAARGIAALVGDGSVTIVGHSLGAALATYLSFDVSRQLNGRTRAALFASPRTGDQAWADACHAQLGDGYTVYDYILDIVPRLPMRPDYVDLATLERLRPSTAEAGIKVEVRSNHHVLSYCAMLSFATFQAATLDPDQAEKACVLGDNTMVPMQARLLEAAVDGAERAGLSVAKLFKAMLDFNIA